MQVEWNHIDPFHYCHYVPIVWEIDFEVSQIYSQLRITLGWLPKSSFYNCPSASNYWYQWKNTRTQECIDNRCFRVKHEDSMLRTELSPLSHMRMFWNQFYIYFTWMMYQQHYTAKWSLLLVVGESVKSLTCIKIDTLTLQIKELHNNQFINHSITICHNRKYF